MFSTYEFHRKILILGQNLEQRETQMLDIHFTIYMVCWFERVLHPNHTFETTV